MQIRDQHLPLSGVLVLLSPWSDITASGDTYRMLPTVDPILKLAKLSWAADA